MRPTGCAVLQHAGRPCMSAPAEAPSLYRPTAFDKLASPEQLDELVTVANVQGWLVALGLGLVLAAFLAGGFFGSILTQDEAELKLKNAEAAAEERRAELARRVADIAEQDSAMATNTEGRRRAHGKVITLTRERLARLMMQLRGRERLRSSSPIGCPPSNSSTACWCLTEAASCRKAASANYPKGRACSRTWPAAEWPEGTSMRKVLYMLAQLDDLDVQWLSRVGSKRRVAPGEAIIRQDERSPYLFILIEGNLAVEVAGIGRVALLQQGEMLGEMSFVDSAPPSATVLAEGPALVLEVPKDALNEKIAEDAGFGMRFYRAIALFLADRLRTAQQRKASGGKVTLQAGDKAQADELDDMLLDTVSLAGDRFDRLLRTLAEARG